jgi:hypothetical protein
MAMARMAGVLHHALKSGKRLPIPDAGFRAEAVQTLMPKGIGGWAWELGPDLLGAAAATAYAGPTAGLEDLVLGVGGSFGGRMAGSGLAYGIAKLSGQSPGKMRALVQQSQGLGGMVGGLGATMFGPRPFTDQMRQQQQQELLAQQQAEQHWLMSQLTGSPTVQNYDALLSGGLG